MIFHSRANKTHFHKKGFALGLILKVRVLELWSGLLRCDAFVFTWWMILDYYYYAFVERANLRLAWLWVDPTILNCADKISNQNGFGTVHLLLLNVQWDLDWELRILWQDWPLKSTQIGKNDIQFSANFFVSYSLSKHVCSIALSLLFHLKSWFAQKLNYATAFARVQKQYLPRNVNITFALIEFHMRCFLQLRFTVKC